MKQFCLTSKQNTLHLCYAKLGKELMRFIFQSVIRDMTKITRTIMEEVCCRIWLSKLKVNHELNSVFFFL